MAFAYDAPQDEVDEAIADLDPVTLTFQPNASSESVPMGISAMMFKDYIEDRSGGKISLDIVWGQAIAPYTELHDALIDGRVDIANNIPAYSRNEYPITTSLQAYSQFGPHSPYVGEMATSAMLTELAWADENLIAEYTDKGLTLLSPMMNGGDYYMYCNDRNEGIEADDWKGRSIRAGSALNEAVIQAIGGTPVSLEWTEGYEALQRNTTDCAFTQWAAAAPYGIPEVAGNISHFTGHSVAGSVAVQNLAGAAYADLPLAYQQIIFDAEVHSWAGWQHAFLDASADGVRQTQEAGGDIQPMPSDVEELAVEAQAELVREYEESGMFAPELADEARELADKWVGILEELGYEDGGDLIDINDWYSPDEADFMPYAERLYEDVVLPHRPE